jgi:formamidopyrimidine-DNA glycosylase
MPELPEVESAVRRLRRAVDRRGKHQLITLDDGRVLHAHFRMTGDWSIGKSSDPLPRFARAVIHLRDGSRVALDDPRALSTLDLHAAGAPPSLALGPEPTDRSLTARTLAAALAKRRGPIKPVLLDQRVIAGIGNIYAAEALWHARISPTTPASSLSTRQVAALLSALRLVIRRATGARYTDDSTVRLAVYDREGKACRRCGSTIRRIVQAGRSTYYCPECQR